MNYIVFDIETQNIFQEVGSSRAEDLDISVISVYDSKTDTIKSFTIEEFSEMWPLFENTDAMIGYNSDHFDIPLLNKYYHGDLNEIKSIDLMVDIKNSYGRRPKLDNVAAATLGKGKISNGLQAVEWWKTGEIDKIKKYCEEDVMITKELFEYMRENKTVKLKDKFTNEVVEVLIDTSDWKADENDSKVTKSLF
jgi:DEAD/DEAH box helicase domain-containing protein